MTLTDYNLIEALSRELRRVRAERDAALQIVDRVAAWVGELSVHAPPRWIAQQIRLRAWGVVAMPRTKTIKGPPGKE